MLNRKLDRKENTAQYKPRIQQEEIEDADKDRIDIILETELIADNKVCMIVT